MSLIRILVPTTVAALLLPLLLTSWRQEPAIETQDQATPLAAAMEEIKTNLKGLAMSLQDSVAQERALKHVAELERHVLSAKLEAPANLEQIAEEERAAHRIAFRRDMARVLGVLAELEVDLLEERHEDAFAKIIGPLYKMREAAHAKYQLD